ncbi:unnamed protein product [Phytophthora fragariaefolia]|uniref:Unnamed protein product n=1 Tax=Phytophthora fragariaefolia TaxID=1490495 RepID=A0A9W7CUI8_9STRA|nr:unnamed protein product [Phytophthora fragariaefolia]
MTTATNVGSCNVISNNEFLALLNLVIPDYVAMVEMEQAAGYKQSSSSFTCQSKVSLSISPVQDVGAYPSVQSFAHSWWDVGPCIAPSVTNSKPFQEMAKSDEPQTSFILPEPVFEAQSEAKLLFDQAHELVDPLELFQDSIGLLDQGATKLRHTSKCSIPGCNTKRQSHGRCMRHGGGKRCAIVGCTNGAQTKGVCKRHGGGARCKFQNCSKSSQSGGFCRTHGGGKLCVAPGCTKGAQRHGKCATHLSRKCSFPGCPRVERCGGFCGSHRPFKQQYVDFEQLNPAIEPLHSLDIDLV